MLSPCLAFAMELRQLAYCGNVILVTQYLYARISFVFVNWQYFMIVIFISNSEL